jgi:arylsulfatase A-like enzyme
MQTLTRRALLKLLALPPLVRLRGPMSHHRPLTQLGDRELPNILILVFDAFSAHHVPIYGYPRPTTPRLSEFADRATVFHSHYSAGSFTTSGTASLLTGTYPWSHRAVNLQSTVLDEFKDKSVFGLLGDRGYHRLAYSHNMVVSSLLNQFRADIDDLVLTKDLCLRDPYVSQWMFRNDFTPATHAEGFIRRRGDTSSSLFLYELYRLWTSYQERRLNRRHADEFPRGVPGLEDRVFLLEDAVNWTMRQLSAIPRPFLAYLHFLPPHEPYRARKEFVGRFADGWAPAPKPPHPLSDGVTEEFLINARREYDEYIADTDAEFGRLIDFLEETGILDTTYVVVTSDHGEMFERGIWQHITPVLFEPLIRIPLLVAVPGRAVRRDIHAHTSSVDLLPTLLQIAGMERPAWCEGEVLPIRDDHLVSDPDRAIYSIDAKESSRFGPLTKRTVSLIRGRYKLVHYLGYPAYDDIYEMYDLEDDPQELRNVYSSHSGTSSELKALLNKQSVKLNARA